MFKYLKMAETRYNSVKQFNPSSNEAKRLKFAVDEIRSQFTEEQLKEYELSKLPVLSLVEQRAKDAAELKQMEQNRDRESI